MSLNVQICDMQNYKESPPACNFLPDELAILVSDCISNFLDTNWMPSYGNVQIVSVEVPIPNRWQDEPTLDDFANFEKDDFSRYVPFISGSIENEKSNSAESDKKYHHKDKQRANGGDIWSAERGKEWLAQSLARLGLTDQLNAKRLELSSNNLRTLYSEKKKVKNELKRYDIEFKAATSKPPNREDKEPMRPLYTYYRRLKEFIQGAGGLNAKDDEDMEENNTEGVLLSPNKAPHHSMSENMGESYEERRLAHLYAQKNQVRQTLQTFQEQFVRANGRKIRYHKDIVPIEREYKAYKEVKADIVRLEAAIKENNKNKDKQDHKNKDKNR